MRFRHLLAVTCLTAPALFAAPAAAQPQQVPPPAEEQAAQPVPVLPGATTYQGNVESCGAGSVHRIRMETGQRYTILASSSQIDSYLRLFRAGSPDVLAEDDDSGGNLHARITFSPPESGEYMVCVSSLSPGGSGAYQLQVAPAGPLPPLLTRATRTERGQWRVYEGELGAADPTDDSRHFEDYELRLTAGRPTMIYLEGIGELDPLLKVYALSGRGAQPLAENDDAGGTTNSFVLFTPETAGTYVVRVTTFGENTTGRYRLRVSQ